MEFKLHFHTLSICDHVISTFRSPEKIITFVLFRRLQGESEVIFRCFNLL